MIYQPRPEPRWLEAERDFAAFFFRAVPTEQLEYYDRIEFATDMISYMIEWYKESKHL